MQNEWFFKWHFIGRGESAEIDSFDGRTICCGGIKFDGTARLVYWQILKRYIRKKIDQEFSAFEAATATYPYPATLEALDDTERLLNTFVIQIANDAVEKDKILRGNGFEFPPLDTNEQRGLLLSNDVKERALALRRYLALANNVKHTPTQTEPQILTLKPTLWGISIDLKAIWKRFHDRKRRSKSY